MEKDKPKLKSYINLSNLDKESSIMVLISELYKTYFNSVNNKMLEYAKTFKELNNYHLKNCKAYKKIFDTIKDKKIVSISDFPMLPVRIFKDHDLISIKKKNIKKKLVSSGTTSSKRSKIYLDSESSKIQIKVLNNLIISMFGNLRLPMLIVGDEKKIKTIKDFDAKKAAISGFSFYGKNHTYIIEEDKISYDKINNFLEKFKNQNFILFGFTSDIFEFLIKKIEYQDIMVVVI